MADIRIPIADEPTGKVLAGMIEPALDVPVCVNYQEPLGEPQPNYGTQTLRMSVDTDDRLVYWFEV